MATGADYGTFPIAAPAVAIVGRRERNKQEKLARIKAAARALFSTKGFAATTTQEIADRADIGAGTLFLYARSKEEIVVLVFRDEMDRVVDEAFATLPKRAKLLEQLMHVYGAMIAFHERDLGLARVFVKELMFLGKGTRAGVEVFIYGLIDRWAALIEQAKQRGDVDADVPAAVLARNCFATYLFSLQEWLGLEGPALAAPEHMALLRDAFAAQLWGLVPVRGSSKPRGRCAGTRGRRSR
jgi:TetR/AcrR family transcriptional regulator, cholesterol catabolism regulator